jgi:hypothetical protein
MAHQISIGLRWSILYCGQRSVEQQQVLRVQDRRMLLRKSEPAEHLSFGKSWIGDTGCESERTDFGRRTVDDIEGY